jgi:hypothetical protein
MKKLLLAFLIILWLPVKLLGNIVYPQAYISEFMYDSLGGWILELNFYEHPDSLFIDRITLKTLSGSSKVVHYTAFQPYENSEYLMVITKDSLEIPLEICRDSDLITVISHHEYDYDDSSDYGPQLGIGKNSMIDCIPEHHSEVVIPHCTECGGYINPWTCYLLDNTPTIGEINTQDGTEATVYGYVYDADHNPLANAFLCVYEGVLETDEKGYYSEEILSRTYSFDTITRWYDKYIYEPVNLQVFPDSTYNQDLTLLSFIPYLTIPEISRQEPVITNYPNPFTNETTFYISIPEGISFLTASLEFYDSAGRLVFSAPVNEHKSIITLSATEITLKPGIYYSLLRLDGRTQAKTHSVIKL